VYGKGITSFGNAFPQKTVAKLAGPSVQLVDFGDNSPNRFASGTLIWPNMVLCAAHSLSMVKDKNLEILIGYHCLGAPGCPPGAKQAGGAGGCPSCTPVAAEPQARVVKAVETGDQNKWDYGLLAIEWKNASTKELAKIVTLPLIPIPPNPGFRMSKELLLVGHPYDTNNQGEPTQATVASLKLQRGPNPYSMDGNGYGYADFSARSGFSGGGVFNDQGEIVGILSGKRNTPDPRVGAKGVAFVDLGCLADDIERSDHGFGPGSRRIRNWLAGGSPWLPDDPWAKEYIVFRKG
jgi:hypothetical protein